MTRLRLALLALAAAAVAAGTAAFELSPKDQLRVAPASRPGARTHLLPATLETTQWGWFDNAQPPVLRVSPGDTVVMETLMHSHNQIVPGTTIDEIKKLRVDNPGRGPHSVTGPIWVEGAEPGDVLSVKINKIVPRAYGANFNVPGMFGEFPGDFPEGQVKYLYLDWDRKVADFAPGIEIPLRPFPGTIGVARAEPGRYSTVPPGPYAGNMDIRELTEGTTLYVPVFVPGALLWSGDSHAAQGNGEVNLTALETAFKEFNVTLGVVKGKKLDWPRIRTKDAWITMGYDKDLNKALDILTAETAKFLVEEKRATPEKAASAMASLADCRVSEVVNILKGVYCMVPDAAPKALPARPVAETAAEYVTTASDPDLNKAMDGASRAMIALLQEKKGLSRLDAYGLASLAMDCRLGETGGAAKHVHCLVPKSLWTGKM